MRKKIFLVIFSILSVVIIAYFPIKHIIGKGDFMSGWGNILSDESKESNTQTQGAANYKLSAEGTVSERVISHEDIFEAGNDILISNQEIEIAKAFYVLQGYSENYATQTAVKYVEEYNAMYVEAVKNGFDVTEDEVDKYISNLKNLADTAENADDVKKVIAQFDSEDDYWNYQQIICQKQLPIQKYVESLEKEYADNIGDNLSSDENISMWNDELNKIKEDAAKQQQFRKINSTNDIDKKFEN